MDLFLMLSDDGVVSLVGGGYFFLRRLFCGVSDLELLEINSASYDFRARMQVVLRKNLSHGMGPCSSRCTAQKSVLPPERRLDFVFEHRHSGFGELCFLYRHLESDGEG